jgi:esterase/lipase superfamily enzyme
MKTKILMTGLILLSINAVFATNLMVKNGDVTLLINSYRIQLEKDQNITLAAGAMVCFVEGNGKVIINNKKELDSKTPGCYQIPIKNDFNIKKFLSTAENRIVVSSKNENNNGANTNRGSTTLSSSETREVIFISSSDKEVVIYDETYGPLPITLSIKKPDGTIMKKIINEDNPKTFFRIPTAYLEDDSGIEVSNAFGDKLLDKKVAVSLGYGDLVAYQAHDQIFYAKDKHTIVDILYGTDRKISPDNDWENYYGSGRDKLKFGVAQVSIPKKHHFGKIERPGFFSSKEKIGEHVVITDLENISKADFVKFLQNKLGHVKEQDILIFIHGYNVKFASAIRRTAQLSYDLDFKGVPMAYSWPSQGNTEKYFKDESSVQYTVPHLVAFLQEVIDNKNRANIHILAHSMGTRALSNALKEISFIYKGKHVFKNIILAAPDLDKDVFEVSIFPYIRKTTDKITLYASSDDSALKFSNGIHGGNRIGQGGDNIFVFDGLDTIDATGIDTSFLSLGHSYFAEKEILVNDLKAVIYKSLPPSQRSSLIAKIKAKLAYWKFKFGKPIK